MKSRRTTPKGYERARELRKELTPAELKLWSRLSNKQLHGIRFRKQHAIGPYIADFCVPRKKLVIELDGSQHMDAAEYDAQRTQYLESEGYKVIRFWNNDVMNDMDGVIHAILLAIDEC